MKEEMMQKVQTKLTPFAALIVLGVSVTAHSHAKAESVSFTKDVKPIFDRKCVSCHACYESPGQLDLRSAKGVERGAAKYNAYAPRNEKAEPTLIWNSPKTLEDWREQGFFSVTEGGRNSIMGRLLSQGHSNPVTPNAQFPNNIVIDEITRKNYLPNKYEVDAYLAQHPKEGMPLAVTGLTDDEYKTIMDWLDAGAKYDHVAVEPSPLELERIAKWEEFLNGSDNRSKLMARYIFEHAFQFTFFFDDKGNANAFQLVRSTTPSGAKAIPVKGYLPNKPVDGDFYYRFMPLDQTQCVKVTRTQLLGTEEKLAKYKAIFNEEKWDVAELPGYTEEERFDPLGTFAAIPPKIRWKFLLSDIWAFRSTIPHGPSCHGNLATSVVQEQAWEFLESPETSLYINDPEYRAQVDPLLKMSLDPENFLQGALALNEFLERRQKVLELAAKRAEKTGYVSKITDLWRGDGPEDTPIIVLYRHDDTAWSVKRNWAAGDYPRIAWVLDLPILEHAIYSSVVNYEQFGTADDQLFASREIFGMTRIVAELNFLRFLPVKDRLPVFKGVYGGELSDKRFKSIFGDSWPFPQNVIPTGIKYVTNDPMTEFFDKVFEYMGPMVKSDDPINRPKPGQGVDRVTKALHSIHAAAKEEKPTWRKFKTFLPQATFLRIDRKNGEPLIYTMTHDRWYQTKAFVSTELMNDIPGKAQVSILEGVNTAYPNFIFRIDEEEIEDFTSTLIDADTKGKFTAVVERWGVRRSHPDFWDILQSFTDYMKRTEPRGAGVFDINRYKNL